MKKENIFFIGSTILIILLLITLARSNRNEFYGKCNCECKQEPSKIIYVNNTIRETIRDVQIKEPGIICQIPACKYSGYNRMENASIKGAVIKCSDGIKRFRFCNGTIRMDRMY